MAKAYGGVVDKDLRDTVLGAQGESNEELIGEDVSDLPAEPEVAVVAAPAVPRFSADGVLLNPGECEVLADGTVRGRSTGKVV